MPVTSKQRRRRRSRRPPKSNVRRNALGLPVATVDTMPTPERVRKGDLRITELPVVGAVAVAASPWKIDALHGRELLDDNQHRDAVRLRHLYIRAFGQHSITAAYEVKVSAGWCDAHAQGDAEAERELNSIHRALGPVGSGLITRIVLNDAEPRGHEEAVNLKRALDAVAAFWGATGSNNGRRRRVRSAKDDSGMVVQQGNLVAWTASGG